jgi:hypothetical protein
VIRKVWQRVVASGILACQLAACSATGHSVPQTMSSGGEKLTSAVATLKSLPYSEVPAGAIPATTLGSRNLGIAQWGIFATSDNSVVSVAALSSSNSVLWSVDVTFNAHGVAQMLTSLGTNVAQATASSGVVVYSKGPLLDAQFADAFKADTNAAYGGGGVPPPGGGRQIASTYVPMNGPCCNTLPISMLGFAIAVSATADAIIVGGLIAVGPIGWLALGVATIALGADLWNEHREYNAQPPVTPPGVARPGGPSLGGPNPTGGTGSSTGGTGGGSPQVTRICVADGDGKVLACYIDFYI